MKHIFIINPAAGKGAFQAKLEAGIPEAAKAVGAEYETYITECIGDARKVVRGICTERAGEAMRFYACGGDGTLNEVVNGAAGFPDVEVAVVPVGTGNDFVKNFGDKESFLDIENQIKGSAITIDALKFNGRYAVNMVNMGFDCAVVETVARIKRRPWISSKFAYIAGVLVEFLRMPGVEIKSLVVDGKPIEKSRLLLLAMANGSFYGGGFHSAPKAKVNDGIIDIFYADRMSHLQFASMIGSYKKGTYLENKRIMKKVSYHKCESIFIDFESEQSVCVDGEIEKAKELRIEVVPSFLRFSLPESIACKTPTEEKKELLEV